MNKLLGKISLYIAVFGVGLFMITNSAFADGDGINFDMLRKEDIYNYAMKILPYLAPFLILIVITIVLFIITKKMVTRSRKMLRSQSIIATILALVLGVYGVVFNPLYSPINMALTEIEGLSEDTKVAGLELVEKISEEGIVLLKNENDALPLDIENINVFGWASTNPNYGGTGSGGVDSSTAVTLLEGLSNEGFNLNTELEDFYTAYNSERETGSLGGDTEWTLPEPTVDSYSESLIQNAKEFSDTALIVLSRVAGEGEDIPTDMVNANYNTTSQGTGHEGDFEEGQTYLELSNTEREMIEMVSSNFSKIIVLYNSSNAFELGWIDEYDNIDGAIQMAGPGQSGFKALGKVLNGEVNPSGRLTDTYVYDLTETYNFNNIGDFEYDNVEEFYYDGDLSYNGEGFDKVTFVNYMEGIYIGYKFYETAAVEGLIEYDDVVQFPFGYGLSYTTFSQEMSELSINESGQITFDVTITNTGEQAGKDVVQVYYTPPYKNGGIEKAEVNLENFEKTDVLDPGKSQTITFTLNESDMASYDEYDKKSYILEEGDYKIGIRSDSHHELDSQLYTLDKEIVYSQDNPRPTDDVVAENVFDHATGDVTYLSRADNFANYEEATAAPTDFNMSEEVKADFINNGNYDSSKYNNESDEMPTVGASNDVMLSDLAGLDYEDPLWNDLLDKLTIDEMVTLLGKAGFSTIPIDSIGKITTSEIDGPAGLHSFFNKDQQGNSYTASSLIASTWNKQLASDFGELIGQEAQEIGVNGWYGPAMNIHRSAFSGRNFEYYSEDAVLSGRLAAATVKKSEESGLSSFLKHFALNDQESNRNSQLIVWTSEQGAREGYLKAFEYPVKEGNATAIMSAFNYIGHEWAGASNALLNDVLRDEWGFRGMVLTDAALDGYNYINGDQAVRNGGDAMLNPDLAGATVIKDTESPTSILAMRQASHNVLYTVANSNIYKDGNVDESTQKWEVIFYLSLGIIIALLIAAEIITILRYQKRKRDIINKDPND